ncbi:hypothetical protein PG984_014675 [Apiospora sp. TS-2023a]
MGWDAAFGDSDIVHNDWYQAPGLNSWLNIAAANVPSPEHGGNVSSAIALSLEPFEDDDDDNLQSLSKTSRHGLGPRDEQQKPLSPNKPTQEDIQPLWGPDPYLKDLCVTVYHLSEEAQASARYDHGDCRTFLSDCCIDFMVLEAKQSCKDTAGSSREPPLVRGPPPPNAWEAIRQSHFIVNVEDAVEWDAFWAYHGDAHDPANKSALVVAQEAVVPVVWHSTRQLIGGRDGQVYTSTSVRCYRAGSVPSRPRPAPTQPPPVVTVTVTAASMPTATGRVGQVVGAAALAAALVAA